MESNIFVTVCVSNVIGIALMIMLAVSNKDLYFKGRKTNYIIAMIACTILACLSDIIAFGIDGKPGVFVTVVIYIVNSWLFLAIIVVGFLWSRILCDSIGVQMSKAAKIVITVIDIIAASVLVVNIFVPVVFSAPNNVYQRESLYWMYVALGGFNMLYGLALYVNTMRKGGLLVSFSVTLFLVPIAIGIVVQSVFYGISVIWAGIAIAIVGMIASMKNELIYIDQLTGIYNRYYLEKSRVLYCATVRRNTPASCSTSMTLSR